MYWIVGFVVALLVGGWLHQNRGRLAGWAHYDLHAPSALTAYNLLAAAVAGFAMIVWPVLVVALSIYIGLQMLNELLDLS